MEIDPKGSSRYRNWEYEQKDSLLIPWLRWVTQIRVTVIPEKIKTQIYI